MYKFVWNCSGGDSSKYFLLRNALKWVFYFLKIIFDNSTSKRSENIKKNILSKTNSKFLKTWIVSRYQTLSKKGFMRVEQDLWLKCILYQLNAGKYNLFIQDCFTIVIYR